MSTPGGTTINTSGLGPMQMGGDIGQLISALLSGYGALTGSANNNAQTIANAADPQQALRQTGINDMTAFNASPEAYLNDPIIQASIAQGEEGVARQFGAQGAGNSGGALAAIQQQGQQTAFGDMNTRFQQLMQLVNAGNPIARANALQTGQTNQAANVSGALAGIGPGLQLIQQLLGMGGGGGVGGGVDPNAPLGPADLGNTTYSGPITGSVDSGWTSGFDLGNSGSDFSSWVSGFDLP